MVKEIKNGKNVLYVCERCRFIYKEEEWAEKCQNWCKKHNSCNIIITKHSTGPLK